MIKVSGNLTPSIDTGELVGIFSCPYCQSTWYIYPEADGGIGDLERGCNHKYRSLLYNRDKKFFIVEFL